MDFERARARVERHLAACLDRELEGAGEEVGAPIRHAVLAPGKRIRPLLLLAAYVAAGGRMRGEGPDDDGAARGTADPDTLPDGLLSLAASVELLHAYSLVHDDLPCMDDDELRRGRPTVHVAYGVPSAIFAGAALMPLAVRAAGRGAEELGLPAGTSAELIDTLARASGGSGMVGGQLLDLEAEGREDIDAAALERIHLGKTARLIEACCTMGALAASAERQVVDRLTEYGEAIGLAFQAVDDVLDVTGTTQTLGKTGGRDRALGKATMPSVLGLEGAMERAAQLGRRALAAIEPLEAASGLETLAHLVLERDR